MLWPRNKYKYTLRRRFIEQLGVSLPLKWQVKVRNRWKGMGSELYSFINMQQLKLGCLRVDYLYFWFNYISSNHSYWFSVFVLLHTFFSSSFFSVLFLCFAFEAAITVCPAIYVTCNWNQPRLQHFSWPWLNVQGFQQIDKETMDRKKGREINPVACADESERARLFVWWGSGFLPRRERKKEIRDKRRLTFPA